MGKKTSNLLELAFFLVARLNVARLGSVGIDAGVKVEQVPAAVDLKCS